MEPPAANVTRMTAIADLDCAALTLAYRRGTLSPVEVTRDVLTRIERHAAFNAFVLVDPERALAAARQAEARWQAPPPSDRSTASPPQSRTISLQKAGRRGAVPAPAIQSRRMTTRRPWRVCVDRAQLSWEKPACRNTVGSVSAIARLPALRAIHGIPIARRADRLAAARSPRTGHSHAATARYVNIIQLK